MRRHIGPCIGGVSRCAAVFPRHAQNSLESLQTAWFVKGRAHVEVPHERRLKRGAPRRSSPILRHARRRSSAAAKSGTHLSGLTEGQGFFRLSHGLPRDAPATWGVMRVGRASRSCARWRIVGPKARLVAANKRGMRARQIVLVYETDLMLWLGEKPRTCGVNECKFSKEGRFCASWYEDPSWLLAPARGPADRIAE